MFKKNLIILFLISILIPFQFVNGITQNIETKK